MTYTTPVIRTVELGVTSAPADENHAVRQLETPHNLDEEEPFQAILCHSQPTYVAPSVICPAEPFSKKPTALMGRHPPARSIDWVHLNNVHCMFQSSVIS